MDASIIASLPASDIDRARAWYEQALGLTPSDLSEEGSLVYVMKDGSSFMVYESAFAGTNQATAAGLAVRDFDSAVAELTEAGVVFDDFDLGEGMATVDGVLTTPTGNRMAWFRDSEGNIIGLAEDPRT
jgi:predicted enzyme related to lactoylglutathione lyase